MTSRERVQAALGHRQPDRVPISLGGTIVDSFTWAAKDAYEEYLGLEKTPHLITSRMLGAVATPLRLLDLVEMDFRTVKTKKGALSRIIEHPDGTYTDDYGLRWKPIAYYHDIVGRPLAGEVSVEEILSHPHWPPRRDPARVQGLREEARRLREQTSFAVVGDFVAGNAFEISLWLRSWEDFLSDLYVAPARAEAVMERITDNTLARWEEFLAEVGEYVDVVCVGDDLGMQDRPIVPPEIYHRFIKKYHRRTCDFIKARTRAKILFHSDGAVFDLIPGFIEAGFDILNPVQTSAKGMDPARVKREFGRELSFWGGFDIQQVLFRGSVQEIDREVKKLMEVLGRDGGYVFAPAHNLQPGVPPEKIDAMIRAAIRYR